MFRGNSLANMNRSNVGVGSVVFFGETGEWDKSYVIVAEGFMASLLSLKTYTLVGKCVRVEDPNFLSLDEYNQLVSWLGDELGYTRSDFSVDTEGIKFYKPDTEFAG